MMKSNRIFFNAALCGADVVVGVLSLFEGNYIMGLMLIVLGGGLGWVAWRDLHE